jgi:magnesium transporter
MAAKAWTDLLDPDADELLRHVRPELRPEAIEQLMRPPVLDGGDVRPSITSHDDYVLGVLLVAVSVHGERRVFYQEVDFVLTHDRVVTVRKTPPGKAPFDPAPIRELCEARHGEVPPGTIVYFLVDEIAEHYLDLLDGVDDEIDLLEERLDEMPLEDARRRISEMRRDLLRIRRTLGPTRDAVRDVVDGRVDVEPRSRFRRGELFPRDVELQFASVYDKFLRATESIDYARELLAAVRDYQQARVSIEQNNVTKTLTAVASIVLLPTFIVGVYGQNFDDMPELHWRLGYAYSWAVIVAVTIVQLVYFRRKRWL